jgi:peptidoglycan/LPS O-acetylase OafA/YrhL
LTKHHIPVLDGLRGLAVLLVLWDHAPQTIFPESLASIGRTAHFGNFGVDLFFVLSGFLITRILLVEREAGVPVRWFLIRRAARIFPIYYLLLVAMTFLRPHPDIKWCAVYLSNYSTMLTEPGGPPSFLRHTWSLCVEEHFYACWPLLVGFLPTVWSRRIILLGVIPFSIVSGVLLLLLPATPAWSIVQGWIDSGRVAQFDAPGIVLFGTQTRVLSLALGSLFAYHEEAIRRHAGRALAIAAAAMLAAFAVSRSTPRLCAGLETTFGLPFPVESWQWLARIIATSMATSSTLLAVIATEQIRFSPTRFLTIAPLRGVGRISYGIYLFHLPIFGLLGIHRYGARNDDLAVWAVIAALFAVATLSYFVIERPILRWASGFRVASSRVPSPAAG